MIFFSMWTHSFQTHTSLCYWLDFVPIHNTQLCCKPKVIAANMHIYQLPIVLIHKNASCIFSKALLCRRDHSSLPPPCSDFLWWLLLLLLLTMKNGTRFYLMLDYFHGWCWDMKPHGARALWLPKMQYSINCYRDLMTSLSEQYSKVNPIHFMHDKQQQWPMHKRFHSLPEPEVRVLGRRLGLSGLLARDIILLFLIIGLRGKLFGVIIRMSHIL